MKKFIIMKAIRIISTVTFMDLDHHVAITMIILSLILLFDISVIASEME